jgi:outer membrane immunogenic protein
MKFSRFLMATAAAVASSAAVAQSPPPAFSWNGVYGGLNIGYGFGGGAPAYGSHFFWTPFPIPTDLAEYASWVARPNLSGVIGGGQIGVNRHLAPWLVFGFEADIQGADLSTRANALSTPDPGAPGLGAHVGVIDAAARVDWFGTARARIGVAPIDPRILFYVTGGLAYGHVAQTLRYSDIFPALPGFLFGGGDAGGARVGWTVGGGVEWATPFCGLSAKVEYLYVDLGATSVTAPGFGNVGLLPGSYFTATQTTPARFHSVRIGLNYRFDWERPAVVAAGY